MDFQLYSKNETDRIFSEILSELKDETNPLKIHEVISRKFGIRMIYTDSFKREKIIVYRIIQEYEELIKDPLLLQNPTSFSYNPKGNLNRANIQGYPVFYGSLDIFTAFSESKITEGNFYISAWEINVSEIEAFYFTLDTKNRKGYFTKTLLKVLNKTTNNLSKIQKDNLIYQIQRIGDLFTHESDLYYNISSVIAHYCLYFKNAKAENKTPLLIYPSVSRTWNNYNVAIVPQYMDNKEKCRLISVIKCRMKKYHEIEPVFSFSEKAINIKDNLKWLKLSYSNLTVKNEIEYYSFSKGIEHKNLDEQTKNEIKEMLNANYKFGGFTRFIKNTELLDERLRYTNNVKLPVIFNNDDYLKAKIKYDVVFE